MINKKIPYIYIYCILIVLLVGCAKIDAKIDSVKEKFDKKENPIPVEETQNISTCPICPVLEGVGLDRIVYSFENVDNNLYNFIYSTDITFLYCQFTILESDLISETLLTIKERADVKIILDKGNTMDFCETTCIPKTASKYNELYSKGLNIKIADNLHYNYCINQNGVFITSKSFTKLDFNDYSIYMKSEPLKTGFVANFNKIYDSK